MRWGVTTMGEPMTDRPAFPVCPTCKKVCNHGAMMCRHCGADTVRKHAERVIRAASIWAGMAAAMEEGYRLGHRDGAIQVMARDMAEAVGQPVASPQKMVRCPACDGDGLTLANSGSDIVPCSFCDGATMVTPERAREIDPNV